MLPLDAPGNQPETVPHQDFSEIFVREALKSLLNIQLHKLIAINMVAAIILFIFIDSHSGDSFEYVVGNTIFYFFVTYYYRHMLALMFYKVCDDSSDSNCDESRWKVISRYRSLIHSA